MQIESMKSRRQGTSHSSSLYLCYVLILRFKTFTWSASMVVLSWISPGPSFSGKRTGPNSKSNKLSYTIDLSWHFHCGPDHVLYHHFWDYLQILHLIKAYSLYSFCIWNPLRNLYFLNQWFFYRPNLEHGHELLLVNNVHSSIFFSTY